LKTTGPQELKETQGLKYQPVTGLIFKSETRTHYCEVNEGEFNVKEHEGEKCV